MKKTRLYPHRIAKIISWFIPLRRNRHHFLIKHDIREYRKRYKDVIFIGNNEKDSKCHNVGKIAVQAHVYYVDLIPDIIEKTNNIPFSFDLFITTNTEEKKQIIEKAIHNSSQANHFEILIVENRGRDVLPMLIQMQNKIKDYQYLCHIHTKKSLTSEEELGDMWRKYLYTNLLGNKKIIYDIFNLFLTDDKVGIIFPQTFDLILPFYEWGGNKVLAETLLKKLSLSPTIIEKNKLEFPTGNMFWVRIKAIKQLFELNLDELKIPEEKGQVDGTILHAVERIWVFLAYANGFTFRKTLYL